MQYSFSPPIRIVHFFESLDLYTYNSLHEDASIILRICTRIVYNRNIMLNNK